MKDEIINSLKHINKLTTILNEISHALITIKYHYDYEHPEDSLYSEKDFNSVLLFLFKIALEFNNETLNQLFNKLEILTGIKMQGRDLNADYDLCDEYSVSTIYEHMESINQFDIFESMNYICYELFNGKDIINRKKEEEEKQVYKYSIFNFLKILDAVKENKHIPIINESNYKALKKDIPEFDISLTSEKFNIKKTDLHNLIKEKLITVVKNLGDGKIYLTRESIGDLIDIFYNYYAEYIITSDGRYIPNENTEPITTKYIREELKRILGIPTSVTHEGFYSVQEIAEHTNLTINQIHKRLSSCNKKGLLKFHYLDKSISRKTPSKNDKKYISHQDFIKIFKRELDQDKINQLLKGGENVSN